jgi:hypothetical protein
MSGPMMGVDTDDHLYLRGALTNDRGIDFRASQQINATPLFPASYNFFLIFALCLLPSALNFMADNQSDRKYFKNFYYYVIQGIKIITYLCIGNNNVKASILNN